MNTTATNAVTVSFDSEELILVDKDDKQIGTRRKDDCHDGAGTLHRAFSAFIFNRSGDLLLQQRAEGKRLWPGYWSNSCCSHPRVGESMSVATERRLQQELGIAAELQFAYKFIYQAKFGELGSEYEYCWVYVGVTTDELAANSSEVSEWRYISPADFTAELEKTPEQFTPWCKMEWRTLMAEHKNLLPG